MVQPFVILPLLLPLLTGVACLLAWRWRYLQRAVAVVGSVALLASSIGLVVATRKAGILVSQMGNWPAPFGISLVSDLLAAVMVLLTAIIGVATVLYSLASMDARRESFGYYPLLFLLMLGVNGAFLTGDIFNLYVWFEVMLISSFVLLALGGEKAQMEGAIKYVTLNLISSAFFLSAVGIIYGLTGSLNMADIARVLQASTNPDLATAAAMLFLVAFGIKAAIFPLFFWLPASYHTPPFAVSAIFSGLLTKVGVYALIRVFTLMFVHDVIYTHSIILALAGLTMIVGVLGAVAQNEFRRILSFHIISQIGYMIMGLGLFTPLALAGSIFYIIHHIIVKSNLFLVSGVAKVATGHNELELMGGLYRNFPAIALLFMIPAMSLAGMPPLSGFFGKLALVRAGIEESSYPIVAAALAAGLLTLVSMTKIWLEAFWKAAPAAASAAGDASGLPERARLSRFGRFMYMAPIVALAAITISIGLFAEPAFVFAMDAAEQLLDPNQYIQAVLGQED